MAPTCWAAGPRPDRPGERERTTDDYYVSMVHAALEEGVNLFDTANSYQDGRSEELLGPGAGGAARRTC